MTAPIWIEVLVLIPEGWHELVGEALTCEQTTSVCLGAPSLGSAPAPEGWDYVRTFMLESEDSPVLREALERRLAGLAAATGMTELAGLRPRFRALPAEDYANSWRKVAKPIRVGRLCVVPPDWAGVLRPTDVRLTLEPGGAFGTGRHATTRGCLRELSRRVVPGARVLDAGSGSGILAVACALLGARSSVGFDTDRHALPYALELARINEVQSRCDFRVGDFSVLTEADRGFDGCLANLYADLLQAHAAELAERLVPAGWFSFSGCLVTKRAATEVALEAAGLRVESVHLRGRWLTFAGRRVIEGPHA